MTSDEIDNPGLESLLREALLADGRLATLVAEQLRGLLSAVDGVEFTTSLELARGGRAAPPEEEESMIRLCRALRRALMTLVERARQAQPAAPPDVTNARPFESVPHHALVEPGGTAHQQRTTTLRRADRERLEIGIEGVLDGFSSSRAVQSQLSTPPIPDGSLAQRWRWFHLALLRLPPEMARQWQVRVTGMVPPSWTTPIDGWQQLAADVVDPVVLVPAFDDEPGVVAMRNAPLDERVLTAFGDRAGKYFGIGVVASQMLWLAAEDQTSYYASGDGLVQGQHGYTAYVMALQDKLTAFKTAELAGTDGESVVHRAAQLAEVLRSIVHRPFAAPNSWWSEARETAMSFVRDMAERRAPELRTRDLREFGSYKDLMVAQESDADSDIRLLVSNLNEVGMIFDCLRPSVVTDKAIVRVGRVIYGGDRLERR